MHILLAVLVHVGVAVAEEEVAGPCLQVQVSGTCRGTVEHGVVFEKQGFKCVQDQCKLESKASGSVRNDISHMRDTHMPCLAYALPCLHNLSFVRCGSSLWWMHAPQ